MSAPIPQPPGLPLLGNIRDVDPNNALASLTHLAEKYGEIFKLNLLGTERYFVSSVALLDDICDEKRFHKSIPPALNEVRNGVGNGLFTAYHGEHAWEVAHRVLVPAFGPVGIHDMYDEMYDIATQLVSKWARMGSEGIINVTDDFTRLTLDSIALCAMDKRFNSFYHDNMHPFVDAMVGFLVESGLRASRTRVQALMSGRATRKYFADIQTMKDIAQEVIDVRRRHPSPKKDLLNALLLGKDPKTGEMLDDESIMNNMLTFLIAGHETTSGMLSFASYYLCKHPEVLQKAQQEVDEVVGKGPVKVEHMGKLPYLEAVLRETLRLQSTAPMFSVTPRKDLNEPVLIGGGKYLIPAGATVIALISAAGCDPTVFGADAKEFRPERMYGESFEKLPPNAWKPFGNGARGCIGRPFAWQEGILALALVLQNFNIRSAEPEYNLRIKQTLTIKPEGFFMHASLRDGIDPIYLEKKMFAGLDNERKQNKSTSTPSAHGATKPMTVLYGSNAGTCEGLAQSIAGSALAHGFAVNVKTLDAAVGNVPNDQPVLLITSSYEGNPTDNANSFVEWLKTKPQGLKGVKYAVFGCGHTGWAATYQKIPNLIDSTLAELGADRIVPRGLCDVSKGTIFDDFDHWQDTQLWTNLGSSSSTEAPEGLDVEFSTTTRASHLNHNVQHAQVVSNNVISAPGSGEKRHIVLQLPTGLTYQAGDYLALLPLNPQQAVSRVLRRFSLPWDATVTLKAGSHTTIPTDREISLTSILSAYVELNIPATKKNITTLAAYAPNDATKDKLTSLLVVGKGTPSVLDILEMCPDIELPLGVFLFMLSTMRIRQYSISSSPLSDPTVATITYSMADKDADHLGVATSYLKSLTSGTTTSVMVKKSHALFHLPLEDSTPIIMACAGTGIAPFRGFVQERAVRLQANPDTKLGEAILFVGCRDPKTDKLFDAEFIEAQKIGAVRIFYAFSKASDQSEGCKYVQDRIWHERREVNRLFEAGARAYICGGQAVGQGIADAVARMVVENTAEKAQPKTYEEALRWWDSIRGERYAVDVFA